jgi:hypothetical protein
MKFSVRRIHAIRDLLGASTYLEIGVAQGMTFLDVDIAYKDAVDPKFQFDIKAHAAPGVRFFQQSSDSFWSGSEGRVYDVIMLDGLHTFEQTARDLLCSLRYAHPRTVWLIDDTIPSDMVSAIPDHQVSRRERKRLKLEGMPWHGDVYKLVPFIHDFLPVMDYVTIVGSGNPQTLVWFANRAPAPVFNDLERISRLSFLDIESNEKIYHKLHEHEAMARLAAALGR